jgi:flagellar assembly protein FliH
METVIRSPSLSGEPRRIPASSSSPPAKEPPVPDAQSRPGDGPAEQGQQGVETTAADTSHPSAESEPARGGPGGRTQEPLVDAEVVRRLVERAERAEQQVGEFQARIEDTLRQARERGHAEGYREGVASGDEQYREAIKSLGSLAASMAEQHGQLLVHAEDAAVEVVYQAVVKILGTEIAREAGIVAAVQQSIAQVAQTGRLVVRVSPDDYRMLTEGPGQTLLAIERSPVEWTPDERVALGGCLIDTDAGQLDGRLEVQLGRLREVLLDAREQQHGSNTP